MVLKVYWLLTQQQLTLKAMLSFLLNGKNNFQINQKKPLQNLERFFFDLAK
jgi:hypothetical protein